MVKLVIKTDKDIQTILDIAFRLAKSEDSYNVFYRTHPGYQNWVEGCDGLYTVDGDIINLRIMEILEYMDCECWVEGGVPNIWDVEPNKWEWTVFMERN